jgi:acyl-CoA synthetase (AMP-forming)/AMP-acid ligase II
VTAHTEGAEQLLAAHHIPAPGVEIDGDQLREKLRDVLPRHFVPARYCQVDAFPFTAVGKVDRDAMKKSVPE